MIDIKLELTENEYYDISFDSNGDFVLTNGLESAILMSILCEKRADESEVVNPKYRRGDWSNELNAITGYEVGSKFWLLDQARANEESINLGIDAINDGLDWLIQDNLIKSVEVSGEITYRGINFIVDILQKNNQIETYQFTAFAETV